jgi:hypothetical protein
MSLSGQSAAKIQKFTNLATGEENLLKVVSRK